MTTQHYNPFEEHGEFFPEPANTDEWWTNLQALVKELSTLLAKRPQPAKKPESVPTVITGTIQVSDMPKATIVENQTVYTLRHIAEFFSVNPNWLLRQEKLGRIKTFTPDFVRHSQPKRKRKYVKHADLLAFLGRAK